MADICSNVNATWGCFPYHNGPLGRPQPFHTNHGEWGPPVTKVSSIDWEIYTVILIQCDVLISLVSLVLIRTTFSKLRLKFLSATFRFSLLIIFGSMRMSMIDYFFRAEPDAVVKYIYTVSFFLHCLMGMGILLFQEGPKARILRPNSVGIYSWKDTGIPDWFVRLRNTVECNIWGVIHYFVNARTLLFSGFRLLPASAIDISLNNMHRLREKVSAEMTEVSSWGGSANLFRLRRRKRKPSTGASVPKTDFFRENQENHLKDLIVTRDFATCDTSIKKPVIQELLKAAPMDTLGVVAKAAETTTNSKWSIEENDPMESGDNEIVLLGPGNMEITVSQEKWNESILYWAKPTLEKYFSTKVQPKPSFSSPRRQTDGDGEKKSEGADKKSPMKGRNRVNSSEILPTPWSPKRLSPSSAARRSALSGLVPVSPFEDLDMSDDEDDQNESAWSPPIRGTITLRGDGTILSISPAPPNIRAIVKQSLRSKVIKSESSRSAMVELLGRRIVCKSKSKVIYMYAEYRKFGMRLTPRQRKTILWLLNQLNGGMSEPSLRAFRSQSFVD